MVTVIIPTLNEEANIAAVVEFAFAEPLVSQVLVVDDASTDGTVARARAAGARVIQSTLLGKGVSMHDGVVATHAECVVFLDGDLQGLQAGLVAQVAQPILEDRADLVKAAFSRDAGRVTALTVKPLLQVFFPELAEFTQPIGGIFAARRTSLLELDFEADYGVDVGLLIDAQQAGARIVQVDIGRIEHDSQNLAALGRMAQQVVRVILDRAALYGRMDQEIMAEFREAERQLHAGLERKSQHHRDAKPLVLIAVDNVVLEGGLVRQLALHLGLHESLAEIEALDSTDPVQLQRKAGIFAGVPIKQIEDTARLLPLRKGVVEAIKDLRRLGYRVALVGDLFYAALEIIRRRVYAHLCFAHIAQRHGKEGRTGDLMLMPEFMHPGGCELHEICSGNVVLHLREHYRMEDEQVIALGAGMRDSCLLQMSDRGFTLHAMHGEPQGEHRESLGGRIERLADLCGPAEQFAAG